MSEGQKETATILARIVAAYEALRAQLLKSVECRISSIR